MPVTRRGFLSLLGSHRDEESIAQFIAARGHEALMGEEFSATGQAATQGQAGQGRVRQ
jgi:hypothetical protein